MFVPIAILNTFLLHSGPSTNFKLQHTLSDTLCQTLSCRMNVRKEEFTDYDQLEIDAEQQLLAEALRRRQYVENRMSAEPNPQSQALRAALAAKAAAEEAAAGIYQAQAVAHAKNFRITFFFPPCLAGSASHDNAARMCMAGLWMISRDASDSEDRDDFWDAFYDHRLITTKAEKARVKTAAHTFFRQINTKINKSIMSCIGDYIRSKPVLQTRFEAQWGEDDVYFAEPRGNYGNDEETDFFLYISHKERLHKIFAPVVQYFQPHLVEAWELGILVGLKDTLLWNCKQSFVPWVFKTQSEDWTTFGKIEDSMAKQIKGMNCYTKECYADLNINNVNIRNKFCVGATRINKAKTPPRAVINTAAERINPLLRLPPGATARNEAGRVPRNPRPQRDA